MQIDILIAHTELRCDLTKKFIKLVWVGSRSFIFKKEDQKLCFTSN